MSSAAEAQPVLTPLTEAAVFLVLTVDAGGEDRIRDVFDDLGAAVRTVGFRVPDGELACVLGIGSDLWDRLFTGPVRASCTRSGSWSAPSTPRPRPPATCSSTCGRAGWTCASSSPGSSSTGSRRTAHVVDETHGFKYFDERDLLGFVDGTENPDGAKARYAAIVGDEDPAVRRRQLRGRPEVPARHGRLERADGRAAGAGHRPEQAREHRAVRRHQADQLARRPQHHRRTRTATSCRSCATTCRSAGSGDGEFGTYFIGYAAHAPTSPSRCWRTCSSVSRRATTTGSWTSPGRSPVGCSSFRPWTSSTTFRRHRPAADERGQRKAEMTLAIRSSGVGSVRSGRRIMTSRAPASASWRKRPMWSSMVPALTEAA